MHNTKEGRKEEKKRIVVQTDNNNKIEVLNPIKLYQIQMHKPSN